MTRPTPCDVCIVGLGPVGAALAARLGASGVRVTVLEREAGPYGLPRAAHLDGTALRVLAGVGVRPEGRDLDGFDLVDARGRLLLRGRPREAPPLGFPAGRLVHQPGVERALRQRLAGLPSVRVRQGEEVASVAPPDRGPGQAPASGVIVRLSSGEAVEAALVVGCDGANSTVRESAGIALQEGRFRQRWLVVDTLLREGAGPLAPGGRPLPDRLRQIAAPDAPATYVPFADPRRRWEFRLRDGETPGAATTPDAVRQRLARFVDPGGVEIERAAVYTFRGAVAEAWRRGRVLLAGDAAHLMPPFLGQGLGAGLRDVDALAPLVERVIREGAPLVALDAYERQRRPHVEATVRQAVRLGRVVTLPQPLAALRDGALRAAHRVGPLHRALLNIRG